MSCILQRIDICQLHLKKKVFTERNPMERRVPVRDPSSIESIMEHIEEKESIERVHGMILGIKYLSEKDLARNQDT